MNRFQQLLVILPLIIAGLSSKGRAQDLAPGEKEPLLRLEAGGPTSYVTALAFSPDGKMLYGAGWDKAVRVWRLNDKGAFVLDRDLAYRVPLGPGLNGAINSIALSDDGRWLAAAGLGVARAGAGFRQPGLILPTLGGLGEQSRLDQGAIYLFNTKTQKAKLLRGHTGEIYSLAFAPSSQDESPKLISLGKEWQTGSKAFDVALRLWDVESGSSSNILDHLPAPPARPDLAVWRQTDNRAHVRVAINLGDGKLRVWDAGAKNANPSTLSQQAYVINTVVLPSANRLITAGYGAEKATIRTWNVRKNGELESEEGSAAPGNPANAFPRALGLVGSRINGRVDAVATVVRMQSDPQNLSSIEYRLQMYSLGKDNFGNTVADVPLWKSDLKQPVLAVSPLGDHVAVAGNAKHEIHVFDVKDLIRGAARASILRSEGANLRHVSFAMNKANDLGLLVSEEAKGSPGALASKAGQGDLIFDFNKRRFTEAGDAWTITAPSPGEWKAQLVAGDKEGPALDISQGNESIQRIRLRPESVVTDFALLPANTKSTKVPLLAIAFHLRGQPTLGLYNAQTGEQIRQYSGHVDPIYSLAFSPDGRLLASVAEDQTLCVWSLTDLNKTLGKLGIIKGVAVQKSKNGEKPIVAAVSPTSSATGKLHENDILEGIAKGDAVLPFSGIREYFDNICKLEPGSKVALRVARSGVAFDVTLPISQGIDDQKPLFSLFVTRDGKNGQRHWVGWNPIGPYEASSPRAEEYLGWHFNTGKADEPARFARADQYHKTYYREGILKQLIASGDPTQMPSPIPELPPRMTLLIDDKGNYPIRDDKSQLLVRHSDARLKILLQDASLDSIKSMSWITDGGPDNTIDLRDQDGNELVIPLKLTRGLQTIRVSARLAVVDGKPLNGEIFVRYQPLAPQLELSKPMPTVVVKDRRFTLQGKVLATQDNQPITLRMIQNHNNRVVHEEAKDYSLKRNEDLDIGWGTDLKPGSNRIDLVASNKDALAGFEEFESTRKFLEVILEEAVPAPLVSFARMEAIDSSGALPIDFQPGLPVVVHVSKIVIHGKVDAKANLTKGEWAVGEKGQSRVLANFEADKSQALVFNETVSLKPGKQVIRVLAASAKSGIAEGRLEVNFQPLLPTLEIVSPTPGQVFYGSKETTEIDVKGNLTDSTFPEASKAQLIVNGKEQSEALKIEKDTKLLSAKVVVHPGSNTIQVKLSNAWGAEFVSDTLAVSYLRPPAVLDVDAPPTTKEPLATLAVKLRSPLTLAGSFGLIEINGKKHTIDAKKDLTVVDSKDGTFKAVIKNVPLEGDREGKKKLNEVLVWVSNEEGRSVEPGKAMISFEPIQLPAEISFLEPRNNSMVYLRNLPIRFRVISSSPLTSVVLRQEGKPLLDLDVKSAKKNEEGKFEITAEPTVKLQRGLNNLQIAAGNGGGQSTASLVVNFPYKPVRLQIDRLETKGPGAKSVDCEVGEDCMIRFPQIQSGQVRLRGRVIWDDPEDDERLAKTKIIRVFVNGFQQIPGTLQPPGAQNKRVREFQADILLNEEKNNKVGITVPGLEQDASNRTVFVVDCAKPIKEQRLHLLALSFKKQDETKLKNQFLSTLRVDQSNQNRLYSYGPLTGYYVRQEYINTQISIIRTRIKELANTGTPSNDVIVFYYQGGEAVNSQGVVFRTCDCNATDENPEPPNALTCKRLVNYFAETPGAHLVFLDVDKVEAAKELVDKNEVTGWDDNFPQVKLHVAMMHYAWVGRGQEPVEAKLLSGLAKAMPAKITLIDMEKGVESFTKGILKAYPDSIRYLSRKPTEMERIVLSP